MNFIALQYERDRLSRLLINIQSWGSPHDWVSKLKYRRFSVPSLSVPFSCFLFIFYLPRFYLLFLPWLPCHFYLVVMEQHQQHDAVWEPTSQGSPHLQTQLQEGSRLTFFFLEDTIKTNEDEKCLFVCIYFNSFKLKIKSCWL